VVDDYQVTCVGYIAKRRLILGQGTRLGYAFPYKLRLIAPSDKKITALPRTFIRSKFIEKSLLQITHTEQSRGVMKKKSKKKKTL
jgi:hypothetical protein